MRWTTRHCRYLHRLLCRNSRLYTEMVTAAALIHGDTDSLLAFNPDEQPLALQVGGSDPAQLAQCARWAQQWGYQEINLNVGCPSDRVQQGKIGAVLMADPQRVADCIAAMCAHTHCEVSIKHRIGLDNHDHYDTLARFVEQVAAAGCRLFIVHARTALLNGLSPKQNREIPPLRYQHVYQLKRDFPQLTLVINGGIHDNAQCLLHLQQVDGVMLGRAAYHNPRLLQQIDPLLFDQPAPAWTELLQHWQQYCEAQLHQGVALRHLVAPMLGLAQGLPGGKAFRRALTDQCQHQHRGSAAISQAIAYLLQVLG